LEDPSMLWLMKRNTVTPKLHFNLPAWCFIFNNQIKPKDNSIFQAGTVPAPAKKGSSSAPCSLQKWSHDFSLLGYMLLLRQLWEAKNMYKQKKKNEMHWS
jgi:hypothetical protein